MPQSAQKHGNNQIEILTKLPVPVSTQRYIQFNGYAEADIYGVPSATLSTINRGILGSLCFDVAGLSTSFRSRSLGECGLSWSNPSPLSREGGIDGRYDLSGHSDEEQ